MKAFLSALAFLLLPTLFCSASLSIDSLSGPVTQNEINSFISYMQSQTPPPTPWGALNGTGHNAWADGTAGRQLEAMGEMFLVSSNMSILNLMINWSDYCTSQRNDLMSSANGGQRVMWTGLVDKIWCPNWPTDMTYNQYLYCGCETEDVIGHLAFCAKLILETPATWNLIVPDGNPYGYGTTYFQRATNYLQKCDESNDQYFLKWFIQAGTSLIRPPTNSAWTALNENVTANNRQMMFTSGFQRLAEAHELLGDNPARVAQYDAIVRASINECESGMTRFHPYGVNGQPVYNWGYYPTSTSGTETTEIHAEYDMIGLWRAFNRSVYGLTLAPLVPFANTMANVIYLGTNTFALNVDGSGGTQSVIYSGWLLPADWNPAVYTIVANAAYAKGQYQNSADITAGILWMKYRRYAQFSIAPAPLSRVVGAGSATSFNVAVAPLGGFSNSVTLSVSGLPPGTTATFNWPQLNLGSIAYASTNATLSIVSSSSTPTGSYTLNIIGISGTTSHTNTVNLTVGDFSVSVTPDSQTISLGNTASYQVTVATNSGFNGSVAFGISGLPANTTAAFNPGSLSGSGISALNLSTSTNTPSGNYSLSILATNGTAVTSTSIGLIIIAPSPLWNGGSATDNYWSDPANWGNVPLSANSTLIFGGMSRLNNTNDTTAATSYSNMVFSPGSGLFVLNGNSITLAGNITNNSSNPQTISLGLNFTGNFIFNGASNTLIFAGGLTNRAGAGSSTLTLAGSGQLVNLFNSVNNPGGTNVLLLNEPAASWAILDNPQASSVTVPWVFEVNNGSLDFGSESSSPRLMSTTVNGVPSDNQVGDIPGATATFNMINGTLTTSARLNTAIAAGSTGIINQFGGTLNIGSQFQGANGSNPGEISFINVSGGTMNIGGGTGPMYVASRGTGTLSVSGTGVVNCGKLDISRNAYGNTVSSSGSVNLDGGVLMVTSVTNVSANQQTGGAPTAQFNFNGGVLQAKAGAAAVFFQGSLATPVTPIISIVQAGGAIIDDGGNAITFGEPLQHDSSLGTDLDGGLTKLNTGTLTLTAASSFNGNATIAAGTLALSGAGAISSSGMITVAAGATLDASHRSDGMLTLVNGQVLTGAGSIQGSVVVGNGATLVPGGSLSTMTFNNTLSLNPGSSTVTQVSPSSAGPISNDLAQVNGALAYGGTLIISNLSSSPFSAGDSFRVFSAATFSGAFANVSPVIPAINLAWNTNDLSNGIISVISSPTAQPSISLLTTSSATLTLNAVNGVPEWPCFLLSSTNVCLPLNQWSIVATNVFDMNGNLAFSNVNPPISSQAFYRLRLQ